MPAQTGSGFTNLSDIINANKNNQLGNTIQSGVQKGISGLQTGVTNAQNQFQTDVNSANANNQQGYVQQTIGNIVNPQAPNSQQNATNTPSLNTNQRVPLSANINAPQGQVAPGQSGSVTQQTATPNAADTSPTGQAPTIPTAPATASSPTTPTASAATTSATKPAQQPAPATPNANSPNDLANLPGSFGLSQPNSGTQTTVQSTAIGGGDLSKFADLLKGQYSGPQNLQNYATLLSQAQNLQNTGQNVGTQGGLQSLLQQYVGGNNYTQGQQKLDAILLGQTGQPQLKNIAQSTANLTNVPQTAEAQAEALAQQTAAGNQAFAGNVRQQLSSAETPILQQIQQNLATLNQNNTDYGTKAQQVQDYLSGKINVPITADQQAQAQNYAEINNGMRNIMGIGFHQPQAADTSGFQKQDQIMAALNSAAQNGMITSDQLKNLTASIPKFAGAGGTDLQQALAGAFSVNNPKDPYTLQQVATGQQASQLNALNQLAGTAPQFGTYGGFNLANAGFDLSKLPGYTTPAVAAATPAGPAPGGVGYNIINSTYGPMIAPISSAAAMEGQMLGSAGQTYGDILHGNIKGAAQNALGSTAGMVNAGTNAMNSQLDSSANSLNNLTGWIPGAVPLNSSVINAPLNTVNSATAGSTQSLQDLLSGRGGQSVQDAINTLQSLGSNIGGGLSNALQGAFHSVGIGGGPIGGDVGKIAHHLGFSDGGVVPKKESTLSDFANGNYGLDK